MLLKHENFLFFIQVFNGLKTLAAHDEQYKGPKDIDTTEQMVKHCVFYNMIFSLKDLFYSKNIFPHTAIHLILMFFQVLLTFSYFFFFAVK